MKISIKNISQAELSTSVGLIPPTGSLIANVADDKFQLISAELAQLATAGRLTYSVSSDLTVSNQSTMSSSNANVYVDAAGSDLNPGTQSQPLATIQEAINRCPDTLRHQYIIRVGPGTFKGFRADGIREGTNVAGPVHLSIVGSFSIGETRASTTVTYSASTFSTILCTGAAWAVNQWRGHVIRNDTVPFSAARVVVSNTADTLTFKSNVSGEYLNGHTISLLYPSTVIDGATTNLPSLSTGQDPMWASAIEGSSVIRVTNVLNFMPNTSSTMSMEWLRITSTGTISALRVSSAAVAIRYVVIDGAATGTAINMTDSKLSLTSCSLLGSYGSKIIGGSSLNLTRPQVSVSQSLLVGGATGVAASGFFTATAFQDHTVAAISLTSGSVSVVSCAFTNCGTGVLSDRAADYGSGGMVTIGINGAEFATCTTAVRMDLPLCDCKIKFASITGSTTGIVVRWGARVGLRNDVSITGTATEVQLDGSTTTFAAMRAATPKLIRDVNFDSMIYESNFT